MEIDTPKTPCVVHLPAELKMFREPNGNQLPKEVPSMIRQPQSWKPKDPKENNTNNVKTKRVEQTISSPRTGPKRKPKPLTTQFPEKIPDVLELPPEHQGQLPPKTENPAMLRSACGINYQTEK